MVKVLIKSDSRYPVNRERVKRLIHRVLVSDGMTSNLVVSVAVVGSRQMRFLNQTYHGEDHATDVLSFPYLDPLSAKDTSYFGLPPDESPILGDIILCYPMVIKDAQERQALVDDQIDFLVEHGLNHLLGKHHD